MENEDGTSLKASGWVLDKENAGGKNGWSVPSRPREVISEQLSFFEEKPKYPVGLYKTRWIKELN